MPYITPTVKNLILINLMMFGASVMCEMMFHLDLNSKLGLYNIGDQNFQVYQLFSHFFMHGSFSHIAFNMFSLYSIGQLLERVWGSKRFLEFYIICGLGAAIFHLVVHYITGELSLVVGASGAISGVFAALAILFPNTEYMLMFIPIPIKAKYLFTGLLVMDFVMGMSNQSWDNIGHWAHIGGALNGVIIVKYYNRNKTRFY